MPDVRLPANYLAFIKLASIRIWLRTNESLDDMEIGLVRVELRDGHAFQGDRVIGGIGDDRVETRTAQLRVLQERIYGREQ